MDLKIILIIQTSKQISIIQRQGKYSELLIPDIDCPYSQPFKTEN